MDDENKLPKQDASKVKEGFRWLAKIAVGATTRHQVKAAILENSIPADRSETQPAIEIRRLCALIREEKNEIQQEYLFLEAREYAVYLREWNILVDSWKFKKNQKARAQKDRPRRYKGKTIDDVIKRLKKQHPRESVSELWPHLKYAIEDWGGGRCVLQETGTQGSQRYEYELAEENKKFTITFDTFRKKLIKLEKN